MDKKEIIDFFNRLAPGWDAEQIDKKRIINGILDNAEVSEGKAVLDVACGTGILFPFYLERGVSSVTGIDISSEMIKIAEYKYGKDSRTSFICADADSAKFDKQFDIAMIYNAFPHFPDPKLLAENLHSCLKEGGRICIAHGASRTEIDSHHSGCASRVSVGLMEAEKLAELLSPLYNVDVCISNDEFYQVSGIKK